jgi:feruloyl esterase
VKNITFDNFFDYVEQSRREYLSIIDTSDIDLSGLQRAGGKVILYHGLADPVIAPSGTISYYDRVRAVTPDIEDFFRFFELPGIHHCTGGPGAFPTQAMNKLVEWVENSEAPDTLVGQTTANTTRLLCLYPKVATLRPNAGNNTNDASSYVCSDSFDQGLIDDCE